MAGNEMLPPKKKCCHYYPETHQRILYKVCFTEVVEFGYRVVILSVVVYTVVYIVVVFIVV